MCCSLTHDLVLPIWKSNVSVTLMLEKRAKRYVQTEGMVSVYLIVGLYCSALSLRIFGEDITLAGKEGAEKRMQEQVEVRAADVEEEPKQTVGKVH